MKAKIDEHGRLEIERAGDFKRQKCISMSKDTRSFPCGDWCPHFGEPKVYTSNQTVDDEMVSKDHHSLDLCQSKILMLDCAVIDERLS